MDKHLVVASRPHPPGPGGQEPLAVFGQLDFQFAGAAMQDRGAGGNRVGDMQDVAALEVADLAHVVDFAERFGPFLAQHGGHLLGRPEVKGSLGPFAVGVFAAEETALGPVMSRST